MPSSMPQLHGMRRALAILAGCVLLGALVSAAGADPNTKPKADVFGRSGANAAPFSHWCNTNGITCAEPYQNWEDFPWFDHVSKSVNISEYIGHDEPSLLFYSNQAGSGYDNTYDITLPKEATLNPRQDGSGGTWNFQLHPAFWLGMAMCDNESAPNPSWSGSLYPGSTNCAPDSNKNVFIGSDPTDASNYMGAHPGTAFMEMQFYPPGWVKWPLGVSCTAHQWCAALNIDSLSLDMNQNIPNNNDCLNSAGIEPVNFAFLTKSGTATTSADPLNGSRFDPSPADY